MAVSPITLIPTGSSLSVSGAELVVKAERRLQGIDLTDEIDDVVASSEIGEGCCIVYCAHTTCAVVINEWEDGALDDLARHIESLCPPDAYYAHDDLARRTQNLQPNERANGHAHVAQMLLGATSQTLPVSGGGLRLGRWQRIFLLELDEPKTRSLYVQVMGV